MRIIKAGPENTGDYLGDKAYKHSFTLKLRALWEEKDQKITEILKACGQFPEKAEAPAADEQH